VGDVVGGVTRHHSMGQRHRAIGADRQDPYQLAQVGPVVLVVTEGDRRSRLAAPSLPVGQAIVAGEGDGGGVVVQLGAVDLKGADRPEHHLGQQAGPIGVEEPVQAAPDPVVVEQFDPAVLETQKGRVITGGPLAQGVDRLVVDDQVANHHPQRRRWGQA
jgi:hypothetical protein